MHASNHRHAVSQVSPSDAQLRTRIQEQMHRHGEVDATKIGVVVRGGEVLLWGSVASEHERTLAGQIASRLTARTSVINHIQLTLQGTPRLNYGRDDFVIAASPAWQLQNATVTLHLGDKTFTNPRIAAFGQEPMLVNFDGIAEFGNRMGVADERDVAVTIKYPNSAPVKLTLKSGGVTVAPVEGLGLGLAGRPHPIYRVTSLEQNDLRLSLRTGPSAEFTDAVVPVLPEDGESGDSEPKSPGSR